jgi:hypothetical protein
MFNPGVDLMAGIANQTIAPFSDVQVLVQVLVGLGWT